MFEYLIIDKRLSSFIRRRVIVQYSTLYVTYGHYTDGSLLLALYSYKICRLYICTLYLLLFALMIQLQVISSILFCHGILRRVKICSLKIKEELN